MELFEKKSTRLFNRLKLWIPAFLLIILCLFFLLGVHTASEETIRKEQQTLVQALRNGAVHSYALNGYYPESLDDLLDTYHITYDPQKFIVEYVPSGANLFPMITVLPLHGREGGSS